MRLLQSNTPNVDVADCFKPRLGVCKHCDQPFTRSHFGDTCFACLFPAKDLLREQEEKSLVEFKKTSVEAKLVRYYDAAEQYKVACCICGIRGDIDYVGEKKMEETFTDAFTCSDACSAALKDQHKRFEESNNQVFSTWILPPFVKPEDAKPLHHAPTSAEQQRILELRELDNERWGNKFIVQKSQIPNAGNGLFLVSNDSDRPKGKIAVRAGEMLLCAYGRIVSLKSVLRDRENVQWHDKMISLQDAKGSDVNLPGISDPVLDSGSWCLAMMPNSGQGAYLNNTAFHDHPCFAGCSEMYTNPHGFVPPLLCLCATRDLYWGEEIFCDYPALHIALKEIAEAEPDDDIMSSLGSQGESDWVQDSQDSQKSSQEYES